MKSANVRVVIERSSLCLALLASSGCGADASDATEATDATPETAVRDQTLQSGGGRHPEREAASLRRVALSTGVELEYLEQGSPNGIPVVFLHGFTDSHRSFDRNLPSFPRRFHVFALDQRGHGNSSKPECCYAQADFAADV